MITSRHNRRVKDIRRLKRCKGELAVLEGPHLVAEAISAGVSLEEVFATPELLATAEGRALSASLASPPTEVAEDVLRALADADSPQGILALARLPRAGAEGLPHLAGSCYLYVAGLQDPGNLGALARVAEAAGAVGLALSAGTVHPNHPRALRASAGSLLRLPVAVAVSSDQLDEALQGLEAGWAALVPSGGTSLWRADLLGTLVLVLGAEGPGLAPDLLERCQLRVTIPLTAPVESLNATVAAAVVLFERRRRET
ncbi:MAG TPA: RNA methyltransferase [Thermoanaerobaculia bacterium]|nr:RNA methyltransferase [Thermoanaerobaculia bacterium]